MIWDEIKQAGLSQGEYALLIGVSRVTVNQWFTGKSVPRNANKEKVKTMRRILKVALAKQFLPLPNGLDVNTRITELQRITTKIKAAIEAYEKSQAR